MRVKVQRRPGPRETLICPECGAPMAFRPKSRYGPFYGCTRFPECTATHGAHPDGRPLGIPANKETKLARMAAHEAFDRLWNTGRMKRGRAYILMQDLMVMTEREAHIGRFTKEQCGKLIEEVERWEKEAEED